MFALSFFAKPRTKTALVARLYRIIARKPPDFPLPGRAIRCLMTPPPRSASIKPRSAFAIAAHRVGSSRPAFRANLVKGACSYVVKEKFPVYQVFPETKI